MGLMFWYMLVLLLIMVWTVALTFVMTKWKDKLEKGSFSVMGPFLMWKTRRGREMIEGVANRNPRKVEWYGRISVGITGISMVTMSALLCFTAYLVIEKARDVDIDPHMLLGLPGLNPLIPLWYGIVGLVVAMVVHEFSHGLLTVLAKVKILSLGVLLFIIPMGAFVEPDEEEIKRIEKKRRVRMYSAGPASNIIVAGVFSLIFSVILMGAVQPVDGMEGVGITEVMADTPAETYGLEPGMIIVGFGQQHIVNYSDFSAALSDSVPGETVEISVYSTDNRSVYVIPVTLTDKSLVTNKTDDAGIAYLGVSTLTVDTGYFHPIGESDNLEEAGKSLSVYMTLPLQRLSPVEGVVADFYEVRGFWSFLPESVFWILANVCYWIFWLNLMVGLSNALPAVPLDGGYIFKDWLDSVLGRISGFKEEAIRKKAVDRIGFAVALSILFLIIWQVIGPRIL